MREIKFRGRDIDQNNWRYGSLAKVRENDGTLLYYIIDEENQQWIVFPEAVGQYTGLKDRNCKEIYEGDICTDETGDIIQIMWSENYQWGCKMVKAGVLSTGLIFPLWHWDKCRENGYRQFEVIGNIYENPELLQSDGGNV